MPSLREVAIEWGRIGCLGFGGPPAHIALLRRLCVTDRRWIADEQFERAIAATSMLPGPASTQMAIWCAWRLRGTPGALIGGLCFIVPGLIAILALSVAFLASAPPDWLRGAGAGAGAAVAAVAVQAGAGLAPPVWRRASGAERSRTVAYALAGGVAAAVVGPWLVLVLIGCGLVELAWRGRTRALHSHGWALWLAAATSTGGLGALCWTAFKVGALSFGGGFVIIPLMQGDAVHVHHWMTDAQFVNAVALGQVTPGPVVHTVAAVGYAAAGIGGGLLAALVGFAPSFAFILIGAERFDRLLANARVRAFLAGAAPAAIGAIVGSAVPLTGALSETWQYVVLGAAAVWLLALRRGVVSALLAAGLAGAVVALAGGPLPG
ncbi:MAG TPA: chromate efflux transporter [Thermoleophilaceae bacterium]